jgi:hypothetical protein
MERIFEGCFFVCVLAAGKRDRERKRKREKE